jgi:hypothetical protein
LARAREGLELDPEHAVKRDGKRSVTKRAADCARVRLDFSR